MYINSSPDGYANYVVTIPASDVFWDPPIVAGDPNLTGYTVTLPDDISA
ncbi:1702_t:CDS:2, partial [Rhizophagus irregularis]